MSGASSGLEAGHPASGRPLVLFAGGGTGGHLYPALAILEALGPRVPEGLDALFLCSNRAIDRRVLEPAGAAFSPLPAAPASLRPRGLIRFLRGWGPSIRAVRGVIGAARSRRQRVVLVSTGGFVSAPAARAAVVEGVPIVLVNLDARPGKANRWMASWADVTLSACPIAGERHRPDHGPRWTLVGPIVRAQARPPIDAGEARRRLGLDPDRPVLMITGASQGAASINDLMLALLERHAEALRGWQALHQCGPQGAGATAPMPERLGEAYRRAGVPARVEPFVDAMGLWWRAAELAVSRAGAGSVAEAWANGVPTLFLPYPFHKDQHQRANAEVLNRPDAAGAVIETDHVDPGRNLAHAGRSLLKLLADAPAREGLRAALAALGPADGAARAADAVLSALARAK